MTTSIITAAAAAATALLHCHLHLPCPCMSLVPGFDVGSGSGLLGFSFSENGYHVAAVAADAVSVWDLRKMKCIKCGWLPQ